MNMKIGDVVYYAVYKNGQYYCNPNWDEVSKDSDAWFFMKCECILSYKYGDHCIFYIVDRNLKPAILSIGNFDVISIRTTGMSWDFYIEVKIKDKRNSNLYTHKLYGEIMPTVIDFVKKVDDCGSYEIFELQQENRHLKVEIENLKKH